MNACPTSAGDGLVHSLVDTVDCHVRVLVHDSYDSLLGPGTVFAAAFTGVLTIYVALIGYRMLLGRGLDLQRLPLITLKIGLIMAMLTSWAAYQSLVFGLLFDGPRELMSAMVAPLQSAYPGLAGDLNQGVEVSYAALSEAATVYGGQASANANILQGGPMLGAGMLWISAAGVLISTIGLILACKIVLGFLLAIGPLFVSFYLFDVTRGLFDGWLRTTLAVALTPVAATVFGTAMLVILQPFLITLSQNVAEGVFDMGTIMTIGLVVAMFMGILFASVRVTSGLTRGFRTVFPNQANLQPPPSGWRREIGMIEGQSWASPDAGAAASGVERSVSIAALRVEESAPQPQVLHGRLGQRRRPVGRATSRGART